MIMNVIAPMGSGKTLFATLYAIEYDRKNPENRIYANYSLKNIKNFVFTQFGFLPFSELENAIIIYDDILSIKQQISGLAQIIANASRKKNLDIIITAQYYTMIPKSIRELSVNFLVQYDKKRDILFVGKERIDEQRKEVVYDKYYVRNAVKQSKDYYDTREVVSFASEKDIAREILKYSKTDDDIEKNVQFYSTSKQARKDMLSLIEKERKN